MKKIFLLFSLFNINGLEYRKTKYPTCYLEGGGILNLDYDKKLLSAYFNSGTFTGVCFERFRLGPILGLSIGNKKFGIFDLGAGSEVEINSHLFIRGGICFTFQLLNNISDFLQGYFVQICYSYCKNFYIALRVRFVQKFNPRTSKISSTKRNYIVDVVVGKRWYFVEKKSFDELITSALKFDYDSYRAANFL